MNQVAFFPFCAMVSISLCAFGRKLPTISYLDNNLTKHELQHQNISEQILKEPLLSLLFKVNCPSCNLPHCPRIVGVLAVKDMTCTPHPPPPLFPFISLFAPFCRTILCDLTAFGLTSSYLLFLRPLICHHLSYFPSFLRVKRTELISFAHRTLQRGAWLAD